MRPSPYLAVLLLGALCGCGVADGGARLTSEAQTGTEADRYGGTAVIGATTDIGDLNPITWSGRLAQFVQVHVLFTPLLRYDEHLEVEPYGAGSWELSADSSALTFHLRRDLFWHDGRPTTAHDWKLAYDLARHPEAGFLFPSYWDHYGEAEAVDSFTFRVEMRPHADFLDPWTAFAPVPRHILEAVAPAALRAHPFGTRQPLGNGPFRFVSREQGEGWTFEANPEFPAALGGRPYLNRLVFRAVPDQTTLLTELLAGRVDFYVRPPAAQAEQIRASGTARLVAYLDRAYTHIEWNHRRPPLDDPRVRRALTLAIDRRQIVDAVRHGHARVANSPVPPMYWQHDSTAGANLGYSPERARRLLADAGYLDRDADGILESDAGQPFRITLLVGHGAGETADIAQVVQAQLRDVGVDLRVQREEFATMIARIFDAERRDFDAALFTTVPEFRVDDSDYFSCGKQNGRFATVGYCNPETDRLLDTLPKIADRSVARPLWREYQHRIAEDQPYTFLFYPRTLAGVSNRLRGVQPDARADWVGVSRWWIDPAQRDGGGEQAGIRAPGPIPPARR